MKNSNNNHDDGNLTEEAYALMSLYRGFVDGQTALFSGTYVDSPSPSPSLGMMIDNDVDYLPAEVEVTAEVKTDDFTDVKKARKPYTKKTDNTNLKLKTDKYNTSTNKRGSGKSSKAIHTSNNKDTRFSSSCNTNTGISTVREHCHCKKSKCLKL